MISAGSAPQLPCSTTHFSFVDDREESKSSLALPFAFNKLPLFTKVRYNTPFLFGPSYNDPYCFAERIVLLSRLVGAVFVLVVVKATGEILRVCHDLFMTSHPKRLVRFFSCRIELFSYSLVYCGKSYPDRIVVPNFAGAISSFFVVFFLARYDLATTLCPRRLVPFVSYRSRLISIMVSESFDFVCRDGTSCFFVDWVPSFSDCSYGLFSLPRTK